MPTVTSDTEMHRLAYDPQTGRLTWLRSGKQAGCRRPDGYVVVRVGGALIYAHRLAFALMGCAMPERVDHLNGDPSDNRWSNLRGCTQSQNCANTKPRKGKVHSRFKGVTWDRRRSKWTAKLMQNYRTINLGYFEREGDAAAAYVRAAQDAFGEFARAKQCRL